MHRCMIQVGLGLDEVAGDEGGVKARVEVTLPGVIFKLGQKFC